MKQMVTLRTRRTIRASLTAVCWTLLACGSARAAEVWLSRTGPAVREMSHKDPRQTDFMQLFEENSPWQNAAKTVKVFKVGAPFVAGASEEQLAKMFANLKKRNIAFAVETQMLPLGPNDCGRGVEGYLDPNGWQGLLDRIKKAGGELRFVAMDEPLWFGHVSKQANSCHSPIDLIARDVASRVALTKKVFPNVEVGDTEPLATPEQPADWLNEISAWIEAYKRAVGTPMRFFDADLTWNGNWQPQLISLAGRLHAANVAYGVIYDGDAADATGAAWVQHAENRFLQVEGNPETTPDRAVLQSWAPQPERMLPETAPETLTYLVGSYSRPKATLNLRRENGRLSGTLVDSSGAPLAGAKVQLEAVGGNSANAKSLRTLTNSVPAGAKTAIVALRINSECGCSGPAHVDIGQIAYRDSGSRASIQGPLLPKPSDNEFVAAPGQSVSRNSQPFAVTPGSSFTFEVLMGATPASANSGYVALAFLNESGREIERVRIPFAPASSDLGTAVTDASGTFSVPLPAAASAAAAGSYRAAFAGDRKNRPAYTTH